MSVAWKKNILILHGLQGLCFQVTPSHFFLFLYIWILQSTGALNIQKTLGYKQKETVKNNVNNNKTEPKN